MLAPSSIVAQRRIDWSHYRAAKCGQVRSDRFTCVDSAGASVSGQQVTDGLHPLPHSCGNTWIVKAKNGQILLLLQPECRINDMSFWRCLHLFIRRFLGPEGSMVP
ncbi:hypothetical protein CEXT_747531 [Caerostris extrusa]|uniref:Uncharacterized protein n=1 Tax=Caerostris extrusa TaxID=172846 RepID=A0AAV4T4R1_CAEEX|nr:hypothetical protein CEXT_747531 [Caerostris extrusa]